MATNAEAAAPKKFNVEIVTPHKLTVAILIRDYCHFRESGNSKLVALKCSFWFSDGFNNEEDGVLKARYRRDFCVLILKLLQSPDLSLTELSNILVSANYKVHPNVRESFNDTLANLYANGTGTMLDIIDSLNRNMTFNESIGPGLDTYCIVSKSSVVGYFLRRLIVNFDKLTFSEVTSVYLTFQKYYEQWQKSLNSHNQVAVDKVVCPDDW